MTAGPDGPPKLPEAGGPDLSSSRRIGEFIGSVVALQSSVETLKENVASLQEKVETLQRQSDDQAGQIKVLVEFIRGTLDNRIKGQISRALDARSGPVVRTPRTRRESETKDES